MGQVSECLYLARLIFEAPVVVVDQVVVVVAQEVVAWLVQVEVEHMRHVVGIC